MHTDIVPLAVTMMAGPQILVSILRVTGPRPVVPSLAYVGGIAVASTAVTALLMLAVGLIDHKTHFSQTAGEPSHKAKALQIGMVAVLLLLIVRNWLKRAEIEQPKWMASMQSAGPQRCFTLGITLIALFPGDLIAMSIVATNLTSHDLSILDAWPFLALTWLIAATPLLGYLAFRKRAVVAMPRLRDWMQGNAWIVNVLMCLMFIYLVMT